MDLSVALGRVLAQGTDLYGVPLHIIPEDLPRTSIQQGRRRQDVEHSLVSYPLEMILDSVLRDPSKSVC